VRAAIADSEFGVAQPSRMPRIATYVGAALAVGVLIGVALSWLLPAAKENAPRALAQAAAVPAALAPAPVEEEDAWTLDDELEEYAATLEPEPALSAAQRERVEAYGAPAKTLLAERLAATRQLLDQAPDERYAIELYVTPNSDPARMERFLRRARDLVPLEDVFVIPLGTKGEYSLRVVVGDYDSRAQALDASRRLPPKYQREFKLAPRSFAELREPL